jgi:RNA polymerase sigma factor (TIGR02999 family)
MRGLVMSDITALLAANAERDQPDLAAVFQRLYADLKHIAIARVAGLGPDETLTPTGLVHEVYLKLVGAQDLSLVSRKHFFACAARAMRQILIDRARIAHADKRGAGFERITLERCDAEAPLPPLLDLDRALGDLELIDPGLRELVELRYFAGLSLPQIAELRNYSLRSAGRDWERARALLRLRLDPDGR